VESSFILVLHEDVLLDYPLFFLEDSRDLVGMIGRVWWNARLGWQVGFRWIEMEKFE